MTINDHVVIVGGGQAASELATGLRREGWAARITLVGAEPHLPYQRPPLSKGFLTGETQQAALFIKPESTYREANIDLMTGVRVERIDRRTRQVALSNGATLAYTKLALATGGRPRHLSVEGADAAERSTNFHYLRTLDDVTRIHPQLKPGAHVVIIGGGYIGLEVAAAANRRGMRVTVLEALPRVLARVTAPELSAFYERVHREAGVDVRTGVEVRSLELNARGDAVRTVHCRDGSRVDADVVIVGIGIVPNTELAEAAGLAVDNGIVVDEYTQTDDEHIVAAGDCTNHPNGALGRRLRLESVPNAIEQARAAAATLCGKRRPYCSIPWFWSDQYDLKLKMAGLSHGATRLVLRGSTASRSFSAFYLEGERMIAADTVSRPMEFMVAKRLIAERIPVDAARLADERIDLKTLLPAAPAIKTANPG